MEDEDDSKIFPQRLMEILNEECNRDSISWLPHGKAFIIRNRQLFAEKVMPRYFSRKAKYSSFTRKLNRWNFSRVSSGPEIGAYYHEFFLRDKPQLAAQMWCKNARTMLAMQGGEKKGKKQAGPATANFQPVTTSSSPELAPSLHPNSVAGASLPTSLSLGRNVQLLDHQIHLLQRQEHTNRLLLERALLLQQNDPLSMQRLQMEIEEQKMQQDRILQMRRLMQLGHQQPRQKPRQPANNRASAA